MLPGDRLFCAFVEPLEVGAEFTQWPLHITLVAWLRLDQTDEALLKLVHEVEKIPAFDVEAAEEAHFGRRHKLVNLITLPTSLTDIEQIIRSKLHQAGAWLVDESTKRTFEYRPHVTAQGSKRLHAGDTFRCETISLVKQFGNYKQVVGQIRL